MSREGCASRVRRHGKSIRKNAQLPPIYAPSQIQRSVGPVIGQRIRPISQRYRRPHQGHEHNQIHTIQRHSKGQKARCHLRPICLYNPTRKSRAQLDMIHSGRKLHQLSWRSSHPDRRHARRQDALQQLHFYQRSQIHDNGHLQLLPHDTTQTSRSRA